MNNFLEVINKGVPISTPINIYVNDLISLTNNPAKLKEKLDKEFDRYVEYLSTVVPSNDIDIFQTLCIISDSETLEKRIHFAPSGLASSLLYNLNVDNICNINELVGDNATVTMDDFFKNYKLKLMDRVGKLRLITSEKNLKRKFPFIYDKYKHHEQIYGNLKKVIRILDDDNINPITKQKFITKLKKEYSEKGLNLEKILNDTRNFSIKTFCQKYAESFEGFIEKFDIITGYLLSYSLNIDDLGINPEKLELYIAHISMETCEDGNIKDKQRFIYYVTNYFINKDRKLSDEPEIIVGIEDNELVKRKNDGYIVTPNKLYDRYRRFIAAHPDIHVLDLSKISFEGMNIREVEEFLIEYIKDLKANWEILPPGQLEEDIVRIISKTPTPKTDKEKELHNLRLMDLLVEKKELYGSTDPFFRIKGKDTFDGYIGFIYPNGKVILDKFYENATRGKLADGEAIYVMDIGDFYRLSHYSKSILIKDPRVTRIIHAGDWQTKVIEVMEEDTKEKKTADEVKKLIKSNKVEK